MRKFTYMIVNQHNVHALVDETGRIYKQSEFSCSYRVRALGRGLWWVQRDDGVNIIVRTSQLDRMFKSDRLNAFDDVDCDGVEYHAFHAWEEDWNNFLDD